MPIIDRICYYLTTDPRCEAFVRSEYKSTAKPFASYETFEDWAKDTFPYGMPTSWQWLEADCDSIAHPSTLDEYSPTEEDEYTDTYDTHRVMSIILQRDPEWLSLTTDEKAHKLCKIIGDRPSEKRWRIKRDFCCSKLFGMSDLSLDSLRAMTLIWPSIDEHLDTQNIPRPHIRECTPSPSQTPSCCLRFRK